jgi:hypothetical protein
MSCEVPEMVERMEFVSEESSMSSYGGGLVRECGVVVLALICDKNPSGDGEMKVGFGRRDLDSNFEVGPVKTGESDTTDLLVDILEDQWRNC